MLVACLIAPAQQPQPTAADIMTRVAKHQDASQAERARYLYTQHTKTSSRKGKAVMCEEITDYRITPTPDGTHAELIKVDGRVLIDHKFVPYAALLPSDDNKKSDDKGKEESSKEQKPAGDNGKTNDTHGQATNSAAKKDSANPAPTPGGDGIDRNIVENMRSNLLNDKSKDGIDARLFPLTSKAQADYAFTLTGREHLNNRDVYHIKFRPKNKKDFGWQGDADVDAYQPVVVSTDMARKIPFAVRTFLGTNVPGLGFTITYAPQPDGVWFPVSFATEFKIDVLFFFRRDFILDAENRDFEKTHGETRILEGATPVEPNQP
jgi:hypothetical protein